MSSKAGALHMVFFHTITNRHVHTSDTSHEKKCWYEDRMFFQIVLWLLTVKQNWVLAFFGPIGRRHSEAEKA